MHGSRACATVSACLPPYTLMTAAMSSHGFSMTWQSHLQHMHGYPRGWSASASGHHRAASSMVLCFVDHEGGRRKRS